MPSINNVECREQRGVIAPLGTLTTIRYKERTMAGYDSIRKLTCRNYYIAGRQSKVCPSCEKELPLTKFPINKKNLSSGRASHCKECRKTRYPKTFVATRASHLRSRYGLEPEEYLVLFQNQNGKCAICKTSISMAGTGHVDHCHKTNKVRGLLCHGCNTGIGKLKDNVDILQSALEYLRNAES